MQSGISDEESHSNALKILLKMGEFFQIQVTGSCEICFIIVFSVIIVRRNFSVDEINTFNCDFVVEFEFMSRLCDLECLII